MPSLEARLRKALLPDYDLEHEIGRGGMGIVFQAHDVSLQRHVAIKIVRPELASASVVQRFVREARLLAKLNHPNIVPVYRAGEAGGIPYYVMALEVGETLATRLQQGPLPAAEALKLGRDVLDALQAVHEVGIVHRDLKPANVLLDGGRALIGDFGIARSPTESAVSSTGALVGTPDYMAPEQAFGWDVTARADLYAAGMLIYEAFTARRWEARLPDERPNWSGVPRSVMPVLRRALSWDPDERWPEAATFRRKLWSTRVRRYRIRTAVLTATALAVGAVAVGLRGPRAPPADLAVAPFAAAPGLERLAGDLTTLTRMHLDPVARLTHERDVADWWDAVGRDLGQVNADAVKSLGARFVAHTTLATAGADTLARIRLVDARGRVLDAGRHIVSGRALSQKGHLVGYHVARWALADVDPAYRVLPEVSDPALAEFLAGFRAFRRNAIRTAIERFQQALDMDPNFAWAAWWLDNAWRWSLTGRPSDDVNLRALLANQATLPELDRRLVAAQLTPDLRARLAAYETVIRDYPEHAYAAFLYAAESQDRGPHVGVSLETVIARLEAAVRQDSTFGPALGNLLWAYIRAGRRHDAVRTHARYAEVSAPPREMFIDQPRLLEFAIAERFFPEQVQAARTALLGDPATAAALAGSYRLAAMYGLYDTQVALARALRANPNLTGGDAWGAYVGEALALWALGDLERALTTYDSAVALDPRPAAMLQAAGLALLPGILRLPPVSPERADRARQQIEHLARTPSTAAQALWLLSHDALARGANEKAREWREAIAALPDDSVTRRLSRLLDADLAASDGDLAAAEELSRALLAFDSAGRGGDPFARAVLHARRAHWLERLGRHAAADSSRRWYQHFEWTGGLPSGSAQAAEIDWALAPWMEFVRGRAAVRESKRRRACIHFGRVLETWQHAAGAAAPLRREAEDWSVRHCRR